VVDGARSRGGKWPMRSCRAAGGGGGGGCRCFGVASSDFGSACVTAVSSVDVD
jgi:hypothetical protein